MLCVGVGLDSLELMQSFVRCIVLEMNIYRTKFCWCNQNRVSFPLSCLALYFGWHMECEILFVHEQRKVTIWTACFAYTFPLVLFDKITKQRSVQQPWNHVKTTLRMHYNMLSDNGSENTTHWNIFWTLTHVTIVITITQGCCYCCRRCQSHRYQHHHHHYCCCYYYQCRFETFLSGNVHVFCICVSVYPNILLSTALILSTFLYLHGWYIRAFNCIYNQIKP